MPELPDVSAYLRAQEILHAAQLSPIALTHKLADADRQRLYDATRDTMQLWMIGCTTRRTATSPNVSAFRSEPAVHGKFDEPIKRIRYADNETNYCAKCQTRGRLACRPQPLSLDKR